MPVAVVRLSCRRTGVPMGAWRKLQRFIRDDQGPELVEWSVLTIIVLLGTIGVLVAIYPDALAEYFDQVMTNLGLHRAW